MVKQVEPLWCGLRNTAISQTGLEGKLKLSKSGYVEGHCVSWNAVLHPEGQQTMQRTCLSAWLLRSPR